MTNKQQDVTISQLADWVYDRVIERLRNEGGYPPASYRMTHQEARNFVANSLGKEYIPGKDATAWLEYCLLHDLHDKPAELTGDEAVRWYLRQIDQRDDGVALDAEGHYQRTKPRQVWNPKTRTWVDAPEEESDG